MKKFNLFQTLSVVTIIMAISLVLLITFWLTFPYKPLIINKEPLEVLNKEIKKGDTLIYVIDYCKNIDGTVTVDRKFVDGVVFSVPTIKTLNPCGCRVLHAGIEVPNNLPTGEYYLEINYSYQINPIRQVTVVTKTESFLVID